MTTDSRVHHIAIVVSDLEKSLEFWRDALGLTLTDVHEVPGEKSRVAFLPTTSAEIELVQPTSEDSGIARYLAKRGPGMHHVCLEVKDLSGLLNRLRAAGVRLINEQAVKTEEGRQYAFIHPESTGGVLVELYEA